ncbi:STAS domain-containing protein [Aestuariicoccus sp. MJ-SS9]|uniref:STAS domain-containing protein n=1 Tax=Aestuariicoccus sp. MJ-SS9 TaxID=3079855 RepID=UPI00290688F3|nr:STAS domain-containing protein [Aestuariicoccus sp. MJ-SS9]MDU8911731.1 STAS domain-containing protein [Aestuariicoccus sp. MJ-SS9]
MKLETVQEDETLVISVDETRIDAAVAIQFKDRMRELTSGGTGRVILDLGKVDFVDSSGLGAIVAAMKQLNGGQNIALCGLQPMVDRVFRLTRMNTIFAIHDDLPAARAAAAG